MTKQTTIHVRAAGRDLNVQYQGDRNVSDAFCGEPATTIQSDRKSKMVTMQEWLDRKHHTMRGVVCGYCNPKARIAADAFAFAPAGTFGRW